MQENTFTFENDADQPVFVYHWYPDDTMLPLRGVVQIAHGMAETAKRYARFAEALTASGFLVYAGDHRGHGLTAANQSGLGWPGKDGLNGMVRDMTKLRDIIHSKHPNLPLFLLGHSMGSFLTQKVMYAAPEHYTGFILSGTNGPRAFLGFGEGLSKLQMKLRGPSHPSVLMNAISFGSFNRQFRPVRTAFDWLSRDEAEVDKFIADPYCGFLCSTEFFQGLFGILRDIHRPDHVSQIPKDKPVYIFCGDHDPVGLSGVGVKRLVQLYEQLGIKDLELKLYPGGRHEMLNEINRDEVTSNVINWLERHVS